MWSYGTTVIVAVVVLVSPPPVPVIVILNVIKRTSGPNTCRDSVELNGGVDVNGVNVALAPSGLPEMVNVTGELNPLIGVAVTV